MLLQIAMQASIPQAPCARLSQIKPRLSLQKQKAPQMRGLMLRRAAESEFGNATHIGLQCLGHTYRAVFGLVVLQYRDQRTTHRQTGAVQGMHQLGFAGFRVAPARHHTTGLEVTHIGAGRDFPELALPRQPYFEYVGLGGTETEVAATESNHAI